VAEGGRQILRQIGRYLGAGLGRGAPCFEKRQQPVTGGIAGGGGLDHPVFDLGLDGLDVTHIHGLAAFVFPAGQRLGLGVKGGRLAAPAGKRQPGDPRAQAARAKGGGGPGVRARAVNGRGAKPRQILPQILPRPAGGGLARPPDQPAKAGAQGGVIGGKGGLQVFCGHRTGHGFLLLNGCRRVGQIGAASVCLRVKRAAQKAAGDQPQRRHCQPGHKGRQPQRRGQ
jgi:hypothetical protein